MPIYTESEIMLARAALEIRNKIIAEAKALITEATQQGQYIPTLKEAEAVQYSIVHDDTYPIHIINPCYRILINAIIEASRTPVTPEDVAEFEKFVRDHVTIL